MKSNASKPESKRITSQVEENVLNDLGVTPLVNNLQWLELHNIHKSVLIFLFFLVDQIL